MGSSAALSLPISPARAEGVAAAVNETLASGLPQALSAGLDDPLAFAVLGESLKPMGCSDWQAKLQDADVVLLGEHHNSPRDHALELQVVAMLHSKAEASGRPLSVGLEMVQQRFQSVLDSYVFGQLSDKKLFEGTEWTRRWTWPFELYLPVFQYCRKNGVRLVALNADSESLGKVEREGLEGLSSAEWEQYIPDRSGFAKMGSDSEFKAYLKAVLLPSYELHARMGILQQTVSGQTLDEPMTLRNFVSGRLLWDESMAGMAVRAGQGSMSGAASRATQGEKGHGQVVVLIGGDHVKYRYGIRSRLERLSTFHGSATAGVAGGKATAGSAPRTPLKAVSVMLNPTPGDTLPFLGGSELLLQLPVSAPSKKAPESTATSTVPLADILLMSPEQSKAV